MSNAEHRPVSDTFFARLRFRLATLLVAAGLCVTQAASAQDASRNALDINRFAPAFGTGRLVTQDLAELLPRFEIAPQLFLHYSRNPLYLYMGDEPRFPLIENRLTGDLGIAVGIPIKGTGRLQFGLSLPVTFWQTGQINKIGENFSDPVILSSLPNQDPKSIGQEDLRFQVKAVFVNGKWGGLGFAGDLKLPTGDKSSFLGSPLPTGNLKLLFHLNLWRFTFVLNPGVYLAQAQQIAFTSVGNSLSVGGGLNLRVANWNHGSFDLMAEVFGLANFNFRSLGETPLESTVAGRVNIETQSAGDFHIYLGAGPGIPATGGSKGIGSPDVRAYAGLVWSWNKKPTPPPPPPPPPAPDCRCRGANCPCIPGVNCQCTPGVNCPCTPGVDCPCTPGKDCVCEDGKTCACTPGVNCPCTPGVNCLCKPGVDCPKKNIKIAGSLFEFDSPDLTATGLDTIRLSIEAIADHINKGNKIRIEGHTDNVGGLDYNTRLSHDRAQSVAKFIRDELRGKGIPADVADKSVSVGWYAFNCKVVADSKITLKRKMTPVEKSQRDKENEPNRRVEINLWPDDSIKCFVPLPPQ
ncbi:MAG: OmpA family protein [Myxococcales bacterium]|nr:OmpA family protein [Myxococcales bacterium]